MLKDGEGITLVALIITVIVLLILTAITVGSIVDSDVITKANKTTESAKNNINSSKEAGNNTINSWFDSPGQSIKSGTSYNLQTVIKLGLKVGDYVNYTPELGTYKVGSESTGYGYTGDVQIFETQTGDNALKWRIWSISDDKIELVAATQTTDLIYFKGATGYNHCVDILNDLCKDLYSNSSKGATARSITIEDILSKVTYKLSDYSGYGNKYQMSTQYSPSNKKYPNIYLQEDGHTSAGLIGSGLQGSKGLENRVKTAEGVSTYADATIDANSGYGTASTTNDVYVTYTYAKFAPESYLRTDLGVNNAPARLIKTGAGYWLASRCVFTWSNGASFDLHRWYTDGNMGGIGLFGSSGITSNEPGFAVRPIVTLSPSIHFSKDEVNSSATDTYWNIN